MFSAALYVNRARNECLFVSIYGVLGFVQCGDRIFEALSSTLSSHFYMWPVYHIHRGNEKCREKRGVSSMDVLNIINFRFLKVSEPGTDLTTAPSSSLPQMICESHQHCNKHERAGDNSRDQVSSPLILRLEERYDVEIVRNNALPLQYPGPLLKFLGSWFVVETELTR